MKYTTVVRVIKGKIRTVSLRLDGRIIGYYDTQEVLCGRCEKDFLISPTEDFINGYHDDESNYHVCTHCLANMKKHLEVRGRSSLISAEDLYDQMNSIHSHGYASEAAV